MKCPKKFVLSLVLFSLIWISCISAQAKKTGFEKLKELQQKSTVLDFTDDSIRQFTEQASNYTIILLIATTNNQIPGSDIAKQASVHFINVADSYHQSLGSDGLNSATFTKKPIFFARCELEKCRETFQAGGTKAGWRAIPKLFVIPPRNTNSPYDVTKWIDMKADPVTANGAEMGRWISGNTNYNFVVFTPFLEEHGNTLITGVLLALILYGLAPFLKDWVKNHLFWYILGLGVYAFSMAGVVFNMIHNPPWYYIHPQNKQIMYIYPSARQQFISEGLIMSVLLVGVGVVFTAFGAWVPTIKDNTKRRILFALLSIAFFALYSQLMTIFRVKYPWYPF